MKYKGKTLKEITTLQLFDPPKKMLVWWNETPYEKLVSAIVKTKEGIRAITDSLSNWPHCAEIPEEPKMRRATNRELAKWLVTGIGEYRNQIGLVSNYYTYDESETDMEVCSYFTVRKWDDTDWHEPTVDYMGIEDKSGVDTNATSECIDGERKIVKAAILPKAYSDPNFFKETEVKIGNQIWMNQNLNLNDGGKGIYFNEEYNAHYYTWEAAKRIADKIPGWHLPSRKEWDELIEAIGNDAANLKANAWDGNDKYGFAAIPAGYWYSGFINVGSYAYFWTSEPYGSNAWYRYIDAGTSVDEDYDSQYGGFSVRLVKDN